METAHESEKATIDKLRKELDQVRNQSSTDQVSSAATQAELQRALKRSQTLGNLSASDHVHHQAAIRLQHELDSLTLTEDRNKEDVLRM